MAATFVWKIHSMKKRQLEGRPDTVGLVNFSCTATQGDRKEFRDWFLMLCTPRANEFTPFADLTEAQVLGWCKTGINYEFIETEMQTKLDAEIVIPDDPKVMPWAAE